MVLVDIRSALIRPLSVRCSRHCLQEQDILLSGDFDVSCTAAAPYIGLAGGCLLQVVYCARAKASTLGDAKVVEETGPARLAQELQVDAAASAFSDASRKKLH